MAIEVIRDLAARGVRPKCLTEPFLDVDTSTPMGSAIMAVLAQLRVALIRENAIRGLAHARAQGRVGGRRTVMTPDRVTEAVRMRAAGVPVARVARTLGVGASGVARALAGADLESGGISAGG